MSITLSAMHDISIHALHEESDNLLAAVRMVQVISIHALHEESDSMSACRVTVH